MSVYISSSYSCPGPDLLVRFYMAEKELLQVDLSINAHMGLVWQVYGEEPHAELEEKISFWMRAYARKEPSGVQLPISLHRLPPYTARVLACLQQFSFGQAVTYKDLAVFSQNALAARAVGNACRRNPFPLLIPCHRVLAAGNRLGGFSCGTEIKRALLAFEGISWRK